MAKKETVELYFDGEKFNCTVTEDRNGELLCEAPNGRFVKFSKDENFEEAVARHNEANADEVEVIPEVTYGEVTTFDADGNEVK